MWREMDEIVRNLEPNLFPALCREIHGRLRERDLVDDEVIADGVDDLADARTLCGKGVGDVGDCAGGLHRTSVRADVLHCVVVGHGGKGDIRIRGEFNDLFVVSQRGEVDAALLRRVAEIHNTHMRQPVCCRCECNLALDAHHALEFIP